MSQYLLVFLKYIPLLLLIVGEIHILKVFTKHPIPIWLTEILGGHFCLVL